MTDRRITKPSGTTECFIPGRDTPVTYDPNKVAVSADPIVITSPMAMTMQARTFKFTIGAADLANVLRNHIHKTIGGIPVDHFLEVRPRINGAEELICIDVAVVVSERT